MSRTLDGRTALALATALGVVLASGAAPALATEPADRADFYSLIRAKFGP